MRLKWAVVVVALCAVGTVAYFAGKATAGVPEVIRARKFELVNSVGRPMAVLDTAKDSRVVLLLLDEEGERRIRLSVTERGGPALEMVDGSGRYRLGVGLGKEGVPSLEFVDEAGESVVWRGP